MKSVLNFERLSFFVIAPIDMFIPQFCGSLNFFFNSPRRVSCFYDLFYKVQFEICFNRVNTSRESWSPPKTRIIYLIFLFDLVICFILQRGCGGQWNKRTGALQPSSSEEQQFAFSGRCMKMHMWAGSSGIQQLTGLRGAEGETEFVEEQAGTPLHFITTRARGIWLP